MLLIVVINEEEPTDELSTCIYTCIYIKLGYIQSCVCSAFKKIQDMPVCRVMIKQERRRTREIKKLNKGAIMRQHERKRTKKSKRQVEKGSKRERKREGD